MPPTSGDIFIRGRKVEIRSHHRRHRRWHRDDLPGFGAGDAAVDRPQPVPGARAAAVPRLLNRMDHAAMDAVARDLLKRVGIRKDIPPDDADRLAALYFVQLRIAWDFLTTRSKQSFRSLITSISMRHTKALVRSEISIPPQHRYVITMPFTAVEEQHYQSLFQELAASCGLDTQGMPTGYDWDPRIPPYRVP